MEKIKRKLIEFHGDEADPLQDSTWNTYATNINTILTNSGLDISDAKGLIKYLDEHYPNPATRKTFAASLLKYMKALDIASNPFILMTRYFRQKFKEVEAINEQNLVSANDKGNIPTTQDLDDAILGCHNDGNLLGELVITILKQIPLRNEMAGMKIRNINRDTDNYIILDSIVLNKRKNARVQDYTLSSEAKALLNQWKMINHTDYLLVGRNGTGVPMSSGSFGNWLNAIFLKYTGKKVRTSRIRKGFTSEHLEGEKAYSEIKKNANLLGHSVDTHLKYYRKLDYKTPK